MKLAYDLGPRLVVLPIGKLPSPVVQALDAAPDEPVATTGGILLSSSQASPDALLKESLDSLGKHGDRTGVNLAFETGLDDPGAVMAYLDRFAAGSLGVDYNPANLLLNALDPYAAIRVFGKRLFIAHAQDARRISPSKFSTVPLGRGDLDWMQLLANFEEIDYRGQLTVAADDRAEVTSGVAFLQRFLV